MNRGDGVDQRLLRYFLALADELHFTRAAQRLFVSQPALSNQIRRLEQQLGVALFERSTRGVTLTAAGWAYLPHARQAIAALSAGALAVRSEVRPLRVDVLDTDLRTPRAVLSVLRGAHPELPIEITAQGSPSQVRRLLAGDLDAGFCGVGAAGGTPLHYDLIHREAVDVILPAGHALAGVRPLSLVQLANEVFYLPQDSVAPEWNIFVQAACHAAGFAPHRHPVATDAAATALDLVAEGACVTLSLRSTPYPAGTVRRELTDDLRYGWALLWLGDAAPAVQLLRDAALAAHLEFPPGTPLGAGGEPAPG